MPLPDPHENELTVELDGNKVELLYNARAQIKAWTFQYNRLKQELMADLGDAYAGTVDGQKVIYYRPKDQYAIARLESDYPDLVAHFKKMEVKEVLDLQAFAAQHSDLLEKYRVRAFVERAP